MKADREDQPDVIIEGDEEGDMILILKGGVDDVPRAIRMLVQVMAKLEADLGPTLH